MKTLHFIHLANTSIQEQLELEERLLKTCDQNYCIVNQGTPRAIVMGISGKEELLVDQSLVQRDEIPVIRRFSGGGTVVVDKGTLFVTFIFSKTEIHISAFPEPIMRWTADIYASAWDIPGFSLLENDYVIGDKKCGGNAQYIKKNRWLHHTSFLWDYSADNMGYLLLPQKRPKYRLDREHDAFLCRMKEARDWTVSPIDLLRSELVKRFYIPVQDKVLDFF